MLLSQIVSHSNFLENTKHLKYFLYIFSQTYSLECKMSTDFGTEEDPFDTLSMTIMLYLSDMYVSYI
jgi:hypothetical protein